jgi:ParB/RepB/Spo0J family partition protein
MTGSYLELQLDQLRPNPDNPREVLGDLDELAASIAAIGVLQRLLVTPTDDGAFMVVDGHRRYWSMRSIDYSDPIPVEVRNMTRADALAAAVAAGTFTRPISPIDQARAFRALEAMGLTRAQIEQRTGCNQPTISLRLRLLDLSPAQQRAVHEGRMTLHEAKLATYQLGRRAPDKSPRQRRKLPSSSTVDPDGDVCPTCGREVEQPVVAVEGSNPSHLRPLADPVSRAEALKLIAGST